jgi:hypothetical protein
MHNEVPRKSSSFAAALNTSKNGCLSCLQSPTARFSPQAKAEVTLSKLLNLIQY